MRFFVVWFGQVGKSTCTRPGEIRGEFGEFGGEGGIKFNIWRFVFLSLWPGDSAPIQRQASFSRRS